MALTGYPVEDLALRSSFVEASRASLRALAARLAEEGLGDVPVVVGYLDRSASAQPKYGQPAGAPRNAAAVLHRGEVVWLRQAPPAQLRRLRRVPVLRARRHPAGGAGARGGRGAGHLRGPVAGRRPGAGGALARAGLLLSVNASPYERDKDDTRLELVRKRAQEAGCTTAYLAMMGGQDDLVFDGDSIVVGADGEVVARAPQFSETCLVVDLDLPAAAADAPEGVVDDGLRIERVVLSEDPVPAYEPEHTGGYAERVDDDAEVYSALVVGLRAYVRKNGFRSVLIGLSGGIDSALVAAIACDAVGPENVYGVSMPSKYSSDHSRSDAAELARRTGLNFRTVAIEPMFDAYMGSLELTGLAEENLQSRLRGTMLMAISNQEGPGPGPGQSVRLRHVRLLRHTVASQPAVHTVAPVVRKTLGDVRFLSAAARAAVRERRRPGPRGQFLESVTRVASVTKPARNGRVSRRTGAAPGAGCRPRARRDRRAGPRRAAARCGRGRGPPPGR
ncbi:Glutamine-dependent NAD(+) synthetase [Streptomyces tendae]